MRTWQEEKAYTQSRAIELSAEMEAAISARDMDWFDAARQKAMRYMSRKELKVYIKKFLKNM